MLSVFVDGGEGTTGLSIRERLKQREDIRLISIEEEHRKDPDHRMACIGKADISFLCLPDDAAREIISALEQGGFSQGEKEVRIIDTSTAHRTDPNWTYGFPELEKGQRARIRQAHRVANPGCHATGAIAIIHPLIAEGIIETDLPLAITSITGYSGGGKKMIADYEAKDRPEHFKGPGQYALGQEHKHLPEIMERAGLSKAPVFLPIVGDFYAGMAVSLPLHRAQMSRPMDRRNLGQIYAAYYAEEPLIHVREGVPEDGFLHGNIFAGRDDLELVVAGNDDRMVITARFDNLGKGAAGAAIQNMNVMLGIEERTGLL